MVFVFGLDVPLVEMFVLLSLLIIVCIVILIFMMRKQGVISKKLDALLDEEHEIKEELDLTKMEEDKQLLVMKRLIKELTSMHKISSKKSKEMEQIIDTTSELAQQRPGSNSQSKLLQTLMAQISNMDRVIQKESQQMDYVVKMVHHNATLLGAATQELQNDRHEIARQKAWQRLRK